MAHHRRPWFAIVSLSLAPFASPCAAGGVRNDATAPAPEADVEAAVGRPQAALRHRRFALDWGTGALAFDATRIKDGRKDRVDPGAAQLWQRGAIARADFEHDLAEGWRGAVSAIASYVKRGAMGGPLLTRGNASRSAEVALSLTGPNGARFTLSAFDDGGWTPGSPDAFARRIASGDSRQKTGFAFEVGGQAARIAGMTLALRAERSVTTGLGSDQSLSLATRLRF